MKQHLVNNSLFKDHSFPAPPSSMCRPSYCSPYSSHDQQCIHGDRNVARSGDTEISCVRTAMAALGGGLAQVRWYPHARMFVASDNAHEFWESAKLRHRLSAHPDETTALSGLTGQPLAVAMAMGQPSAALVTTETCSAYKSSTSTLVKPLIIALQHSATTSIITRARCSSMRASAGSSMSTCSRIACGRHAGMALWPSQSMGAR